MNAALTNSPNIKGAVPLTNRAPGGLGNRSLAEQKKRELDFVAAVRNQAKQRGWPFGAAWDFVRRAKPELWPWGLNEEDKPR